MFLEHIFGRKNKIQRKKDNIKIIDGKIIEEIEGKLDTYNEKEEKTSKILTNDIFLDNTVEEIKSISQKQGRPPRMDGFFITLEVSGRSKRTIETYKYAIKYWEVEANKKNKSIYTMKYRDVEEIMIKWQSNTRKKRYSALNQLSKWYLREGYPNLSIELSKVIKTNERKSRIPKAKSIEEFKEIREVARDMVGDEKREGIWLALMLLCGLRISEIETVECGEDYIQVIGKGSKERRVPCPKWLLEKLGKSEKDGRGGYRKQRKVIDKSLRKMGYSKFHSLRHTYATMFLKKGKRIEEIQKLLGHASISTTQVYLKTEVPKDVVELLEGIK